jgi:hypothetical protein
VLEKSFRNQKPQQKELETANLKLRQANEIATFHYYF